MEIFCNLLYTKIKSRTTTFTAGIKYDYAINENLVSNHHLYLTKPCLSSPAVNCHRNNAKPIIPSDLISIFLNSKKKWQSVSASQHHETDVSGTPSAAPVSNQPPSPSTTAPPSSTSGSPKPQNPTNPISSSSMALAPTQCGNTTTSSLHSFPNSTSTSRTFYSSANPTRPDPNELNTFRRSVLSQPWKSLVLLGRFT